MIWLARRYLFFGRGRASERARRIAFLTAQFEFCIQMWSDVFSELKEVNDRYEKLLGDSRRQLAAQTEHRTLTSRLLRRLDHWKDAGQYWHEELKALVEGSEN